MLAVGVDACVVELVAEESHGGWEWWWWLRVPHGLGLSEWRAERLRGG